MWRVGVGSRFAMCACVSSVSYIHPSPANTCEPGPTYLVCPQKSSARDLCSKIPPSCNNTRSIVFPNLYTCHSFTERMYGTSEIHSKSSGMLTPFVIGGFSYSGYSHGPYKKAQQLVPGIHLKTVGTSQKWCLILCPFI